jgi:hypothetical protein
LILKLNSNLFVLNFFNIQKVQKIYDLIFLSFGKKIKLGIELVGWLE